MTSTPTPRSRPAPDQPRRVLSARGPEDLLAAVPVVLGFQPRDSAVMLTFGGPQSFHARADLPAPRHLDDLAELLLEPALRHQVGAVAFVVYTDDASLAQESAEVLARTFAAAGVVVEVVLCADGERWWCPQADRRAGGVPYDLSLHPFRLQSVVDGQITHGSRAALAQTLATDVEAAAVVAALVPSAPRFDAVDVAGCVAHHVEHDTVLTDAQLAEVAAAIRTPAVRDGAWTLIARDVAHRHARLWSDAVRRSPPDLLGGPAAVLGLAAWLAGQGALAWCAVDRALEVDPDNSLARLVGDLLSAAVPPSSWSEIRGEGRERH